MTLQKEEKQYRKDYNMKPHQPLILEQIIDIAYDWMFNNICDIDDDLYELSIEYQNESGGKTLKRSWRDRDNRLRATSQEREALKI